MKVLWVTYQETLCCGAISVLAGLRGTQSTQGCRAGTGRTISPASLVDVFMTHHRAAPSSASAVPLLLEL